MADPHLLLPSSADLTRAFIKDLGNVLEGQGDSTPWSSVFFFATSNTASTWTTDRDVMLRGILNVSGTASSVLDLDGTSYQNTFTATAHGKKNVIWIGGSSQQVFYPLTWAVAGATKVTFFNNSASNGAILLYYT